MDMTAERQHRRSHLFTVRLWVEQIAEDRAEVRGRVQHVLSGDARYFRTWQMLTAILNGILHELEDPKHMIGDAGDGDSLQLGTQPLFFTDKGSSDK